MNHIITIAAGGTGGHLFPAQSLAQALNEQGFAVQLVTDERVASYGHDFPAFETHLIPSATFASKNPFALLKTVFTLVRGVLKARALFKKNRPSVVVGFGGYPTFPPLIAAWSLKIPTLIHEQNAVMGRANKALSRLVTGIATGFAGALDGMSALKAKSIFTGNPLRPKVIAASLIPYEEPKDEFKLLVFGGSQGARVMSDIVPHAIAKLAPHLQSRLRVIQQAREEDKAQVQTLYDEMGVIAQISPFFSDLPNMMAHSHLIIGRSGASTVAEIAAIGRASILVPLPNALDNDQLMNATMLSSSFAAILVKQADFTPEYLAGELIKLMNNPNILRNMAENAHALGTTDAAERLAAVVTRMVENQPRPS